jgi:general secretion pathway protein K
MKKVKCGIQGAEFRIKNSEFRVQKKEGRLAVKKTLCYGPRLLVSEKGMALVLTLMILAIVTAIVIEFSYGVYTATTSLYNWKDSQRLSFVAASGVSLALKTISDTEGFYPYTYPGDIEMPVVNLLDGFRGSVLIRVEDESARLNLNSILKVWPDGTRKVFDSFKRLIRNLDLDETIAERVADWIDKNNKPMLIDSEEDAKNAYMDSVDELLLIRGIDSESYEKLLPYVTVYGLMRIDADLININTAPIPVIMSFDERITRELAERIVDYRDLSPFEKTSDIVKVAGFEGPLGFSFMGRIVVKTSNYRITSIAEENRIKRIIHCVVEVKGNSHITRYWRET